MKPTVTPTAKVTATPTAKVTAAPTVKATATPTAKVTATPTAKVTATPTAKVTAAPTVKATATPTVKVTATPTVQAAVLSGSSNSSSSVTTAGNESVPGISVPSAQTSGVASLPAQPVLEFSVLGLGIPALLAGLVYLLMRR